MIASENFKELKGSFFVILNSFVIYKTKDFSYDYGEFI